MEELKVGGIICAGTYEKIHETLIEQGNFGAENVASNSYLSYHRHAAMEKRMQESEQHFDIIDALLGAGVPHIVEHILSFLDAKSLAVSEQVSTLWRDVIEDLPIWKHMVKENVKNKPIWKELFERRGWCKYLDVPLTKQMSSYYCQLHRTASNDIHSLKTNWRRGCYTDTKIKTGSSVLCLQYDGNKIVTGHGNGTIKIWDKSTLQISKILEGHQGIVWCLQYNEAMVISGSDDYTVNVWDIQMGQVVNSLPHDMPVLSMKFTAKTLVTGSEDSTVTIWDIKSPTIITLRTVLNGHEDGVWAVELSETNIMSGYGNGTIKVWDIFTAQLVRTIHGHSDRVKSLHLQGSHLISGSYDKTVRIWNIDNGECVRVLCGHNGYVLCVALNDKTIVSGSSDKAVKVWDLAAALDSDSSSDTLCITTLKEHTDWVNGLQLDDFWLISGSADGTVTVYDFLNPESPILRK